MQYSLTGDETSLQPFVDARQDIPAAETTLQALLTNDRGQRRPRLSQIHEAVQLKLTELTRAAGLPAGLWRSLLVSPCGENQRFAKNSTPGRRGCPTNVLVVQDDAGVRSFTVSALRELGDEVVDADAAAVAREKFAENPR